MIAQRSMLLEYQHANCPKDKLKHLPLPESGYTNMLQRMSANETRCFVSGEHESQATVSEIDVAAF